MLLTKDDLSVLVAAAIECLDGLANTEYMDTWEGVFDRYGSRPTLAKIAQNPFAIRQAAALAFFEKNYEATSGVLHLMQFVMSIIWENWDRVELKADKEKGSIEDGKGKGLYRSEQQNTDHDCRSDSRTDGAGAG